MQSNGKLTYCHSLIKISTLCEYQPSYMFHSSLTKDTVLWTRQPQSQRLCHKILASALYGVTHPAEQIYNFPFNTRIKYCAQKIQQLKKCIYFITLQFNESDNTKYKTSLLLDVVQVWGFGAYKPIGIMKDKTRL